MSPLIRLVVLLTGIHGTVRSAGEARPVAGIHVELDGVERTTTDSAGRYTIAGVAAGPHQLRFVSGGYEARQLTVLLADSSALALDVELTPRPVFLPPIAVVARGSDDSNGTGRGNTTEWHEAGQYRFAPGWQANQPAGSVDIQDALARVPGVATHGDNTNALSVHGARGSENLMLLDGIPLFGAVHFAGASSAVNPDAIAAMDVHTGVSSARFGNALSGVVELETSETSGGGQLTGDLSTADVRSVARTQLGSSGGVVLGARSSFRNLMSDGVGFGIVNGYQDFLAVGSAAVGPGVVRLIGFESGNRLQWEPLATSDLASASDLRTVNTGMSVAPLSTSNNANWQSGALGATWAQPLGPGRDWHTAAWWSGNSATITTLGTDRTERLTSALGELGLSTEWHQRFSTSALLFGGEVTRPAIEYRAATLFTQAGATYTGVDLNAAPVLGALYGEWDWHGSSIIDFRAGLRGNTDFRQSVSLDPRVEINLHPALATRIELGFGRTHQATQSMLNEENLMSGLIGPALLVNGANGAPTAVADQLVFSVIRQVATGITVALDGYLRDWRNVLAPAVTSAGFFVATTPAYGDGNARGINASVSVARQRLTLRVSAGLAASVQRAGGISYPSSFDEPWTFAGDVNYRLPNRTTLQLRWNAGAGQPATAVLSGIEWTPYQPATGLGEIQGNATNLTGAINALRLAGPLRLDVGARHEWRVGDNGGGITTAVRLENLFNRADPVGVTTGPDGSLQLLRGTPRGLVFEVGWAH